MSRDESKCWGCKRAIPAYELKAPEALPQCPTCGLVMYVCKHCDEGAKGDAFDERFDSHIKACADADFVDHGGERRL